MALTLLTGGARSGKSALAVRAAAESGRPVVFIATANAASGDAEFSERIERHRSERPRGWAVVEEPVELETALRAAGGDACVVVDCLSLWVANLLERDLSHDAVLDAASGAARAAAQRPGPAIAVTNEVGWGIVPDNPVGRAYRDLLGRVNQLWAHAAERAALVVAGYVLELERDSQVLP
jgi:adenosylcobinamide kinase / adenosylcobinamide-phosphate guanylyltransferase